MVLQLRRHRAVLSQPPAIHDARQAFSEREYLKLPGFLEPALLRAIQAALDREAFHSRTHDGIGIEHCLAPGATSGLLEFLANDARVLNVVERITGCGPIGCFHGRVYRMVPGLGHYDSWHSDVGDDRLVAMSVNLSADVYEGGVLQIRRADSLDVLHEVSNVGFGDAVLFRIAPHLRHRVTSLRGAAAKTAYAGWFRSRPRYDELFRARLRDTGSGLTRDSGCEA
jgi:hypothetical protein